MTQYLARLYWYTVEFGSDPRGRQDQSVRRRHPVLVHRDLFCIDDPSPNRIEFDLERVMNTLYRIDDFQETYFVLESFSDLFAALKQDLAPDLRPRQGAARPRAGRRAVPRLRLLARHRRLEEAQASGLISQNADATAIHSLSPRP